MTTETEQLALNSLTELQHIHAHVTNIDSNGIVLNKEVITKLQDNTNKANEVLNAVKSLQTAVEENRKRASLQWAIQNVGLVTHFKYRQEGQQSKNSDEFVLQTLFIFMEGKGRFMPTDYNIVDACNRVSK